ncbi:hypothetical protein BC827DRAFT_880682 [Russula dissimulans]|nr:hypothetical protein BC827DRAFT_880682 [Russula dissimulans]
MSSTPTSSASFQSILDAAFNSYAKQTGVKLAEHHSADKLQNCHSSDDVLQVLTGGKMEFQDYRDKHRKLLDRLRPIVQVVHTLSAVLGGVAGFVPFQPTKLIFVAIDVLLLAAIRVTGSYDALLELFECIANFLKRVHIYTRKISLPSTMSDIIVQMMVEVLTVLALATKEIKQGRFNVPRRRRRGGYPQEIRRTHAGRNPDGCGPYSGSGSRTRG